MKAIRVSGTWGRRGGKVSPWLLDGDFARIARVNGVTCIPHDPIWSTAEDGLLVEDAESLLFHRPRDAAWRAGGIVLANALVSDPSIDTVITHSHGAQVASVAWRRLTVGRVSDITWLAVDPPVRREEYLRNGYMAMGCHGRIVQTISSAWNWRSWPRWAGSRRLPWDRAALPWATVIDQPGGHSEVLEDPDAYREWWGLVLAEVAREAAQRC